MPALLVLVVQEVPRSTSWAVTATLGRAAPAGSVMVPVVAPAACCAHTGELAPKVIKQRQTAPIARERTRSFNFTEISSCTAGFAWCLLFAWEGLGWDYR